MQIVHPAYAKYEDNCSVQLVHEDEGSRTIHGARARVQKFIQDDDGGEMKSL